VTDAPDYTTMSGAEFQRAVGADPEKWAAALSQFLTSAAPPGTPPAPLLTSWFVDAMAAAVKAHSLGPLRPEPEAATLAKAQAALGPPDAPR
jgi:hypothetical protein